MDDPRFNRQWVRSVLENTASKTNVSRAPQRTEKSLSDESDKEPKSCLDALCFHIESRSSSLEALFLNNCKISDDGAINILQTLLYGSNQKLFKLYMNQNFLTDKTGLKAAQLFAEGTTKLKELGLKWNKLTAVSGNKIAETLRENREMRILDLSWNSIGVKPKDQRQKGKVIQLMKQGEIG